MADERRAEEMADPSMDTSGLDRHLIMSSMDEIGQLVDSSHLDGYEFVPLRGVEQLVRDLARYAGVPSDGTRQLLTGIVDRLDEGAEAIEAAGTIEELEEEEARLKDENKSLEEQVKDLTKELEEIAPLEAKVDRLRLESEALKLENESLRRQAETLGDEVEGNMLTREDRLSVITALTKAIKIMNTIPGQKEHIAELMRAHELLEELEVSRFRPVIDDERANRSF